VLTVRALPTFASNWLVPRLPHFKAAHADFDVRIDGSFDLVDFVRDQVDILLHYDDWKHAGLLVEPLFEEDVFPKCSPHLIDSTPLLQTPADLREHTLLHVDFHAMSRDWPDWDVWLHAAGLDLVNASEGPRFPHQSPAIQSAEHALGSAMAFDALAAGRIVKPFDISIKAGLIFCLFCPTEALNTHKIKAFRTWIVAANPPTRANTGLTMRCATPRD
jgi:LysR family glycine cleavage system transcriptional activator